MDLDVHVLSRDEIADAARDLLGLLRELSASAAELDESVLSQRMCDDRVRVVVAYVDGQLVGTATLTMLVTLSDGLVGRVEDVVVSSAARGGGVGRAMMQLLHDEAHRAGVTQLDLTSRATREAANHLYRALGYERRETNVYRLVLPSDARR